MVTKVSQLILGHLAERTSKGLANAVSEAIGAGVLVEGERLPPIRTVAADLDLSPSTVSVAWRLLAGARAIRSDGRRGTVVMARSGPGPTRYRRALERSLNFSIDLSTGVPDPALLPDLAPALANLPRGWSAGSYLDDPIIAGLVEKLQEDWPYPAADYAIVDGAMDALDQVSTHLLRFGDVVVVENPCFPPLLDLLDALGARVVGVDVDDDGLVADQLGEALALKPRAVFLQPRAHNPYGSTMTTDRAEAIAALLGGSDCTVIEDDSAGAIASTAPISLGAWLPEQTIHIRSFSKSHGPDLRLAAMSGPSVVMDGLRERRLLGQGWTSRLLQIVLLELLSREESCQQVEAARVTYAHRRDAVVSALAREGVVIGGRDGLNLWLPVRNEMAAMLYLASRGIGAAAGSPFMTRDDSSAHLRITVGMVARDFATIAQELAHAASLAAMTGPR